MDSFIGWVGGKKLLRKAIYERFPNSFSKYIEPFGGAAWVLFFKDKHATTEIYNDINGQLVNLFRCLKYHPEAVDNELSLLLNSREIFKNFLNQNIDSFTDIQKAARFYYIIKISYGSKGKTFGMKGKKITAINRLSQIHKRLESVVIENKPYNDLIMQYDSIDSFFYIDPPYYQTEHYYDNNGYFFNKDEHIKLRDILQGIRGKFILSYNDCHFIRDLYFEFNCEAISRPKNLATKQGKERVYNELIIKNY